MSDTNIFCPKCGAEIELTEAVAHRLREEMQAQFDRDRAALNAALKAREDALKAEENRLTEARKNAEEELTRRVEAECKRMSAEALQRAEAKLGAEKKQLEEELTQQREKLRAAQQTELALLKQKRELEAAKDAMDLEVARKLDTERNKIAETARQQAAEAERLKLADKDNKIEELRKQIGELQQKAEQGSMQAQGETLEIELENILRSMFIHDEITEIKQGQRGADVIQRIRTNTGLHCGAILWEAKRARNWSAQWPEKLKEDQRETKAELAVIVTTCPPAGIRGMGEVEGIWVAEPQFALCLASALRHGLLSTAAQRLQQTDRVEKMAVLYDHLCSVEFRQHIEAVVESFVGLQQQLAAEQRSFARQWKEREQQLDKALRHTAMLYGGIQGIAGREALPEISSLALLPGERPAFRSPAAAHGESEGMPRTPRRCAGKHLVSASGVWSADR